MLAPVVVALFGGSSSAQPSGRQDPLDDFKRWWAEAARYSPPRLVHLQWRELLHFDPEISIEDLAAMGPRVEDRPDHPEREVLARERRRRLNGPDEVVLRVWYGRPGTLRVNRDELWRDFYIDVALTDSARWSMVPSHLNLISAGHPPPNRDYGSYETEVLHRLRETVWSNFGSPLEPIRATLEGGTWIGVAAKEGLSSVRWEGIESEDASRVLPSRSVVESAAATFDEFAGRETRYLDWAYEPVLEQWVARHIVERDARGRVLREVKLEVAEPIDRALVHELTAIPNANRADAIRGLPTFRTVMDFRPGEERILTRTETGIIEHPMPASTFGSPRQAWMRPIGWAAAGLIVVALVAIRVVRQRQARADG